MSQRGRNVRLHVVVGRCMYGSRSKYRRLGTAYFLNDAGIEHRRKTPIADIFPPPSLRGAAATTRPRTLDFKTVSAPPGWEADRTLSVYTIQ